MTTHNTQGHATRFAPPELLIDGKRNLVGLTLDELKAEMVALGIEPFRAKQIWTAIYCHGIKDFDLMTTLAKPVRQKIADVFNDWPS